MNTPLVNAEWLKRNSGDPDVIVLDASPTSNMSALKVQHPGERIRGARAFNLKEQFPDKDSELPNMMPSSAEFTHACQNLGIHTDSKIVIYDNLGLYSSPRAWWMFKTMGHEKVAVLDGGLKAWVSYGGRTESIAEQVNIKGDFVAKYEAGKIKNSAQLFENILSKDFAVVDARSTERFNAEAPEPRPTSRTGHIPGSYNLPYTKLCRDGKLLPKDKLRTLFNKMNLGDLPLVFTCGSGVTACINILSATLVLDNELGLYDGSWSEWGDVDAKWPVV